MTPRHFAILVAVGVVVIVASSSGVAWYLRNADAQENDELRVVVQEQAVALGQLTALAERNDCITSIEAELWSTFADVIRHPPDSPERAVVTDRLAMLSDRFARISDPDVCGPPVGDS